MKLSVCMIVKNEEPVIENCLQSIKGADEIVIVDTGSSDKTSDICRKYTDKYIENEFKWNDNFADARNYVLSKATGDWVLSIDADEHLEPGGIDKAREIIANAKSLTVDIILKSASRGDEHYYPRLFRRCPEVFWCGAIHNYLSIPGSEKGNLVITYGYSPAHSKDPDRAFRILKAECARNPKAARERFYLAREFWYRKDYEQALHWYRRYFENAYWAPEMADARLMMAKCLWHLGRGDQAKDECLQAIKINANFKEALEFMANLSGPGNKKRWIEFAETASNENVLFKKG